MNNQRDEFINYLAQSFNGRATLKLFSGLTLACLALAKNGQAAPTYTDVDYPGAFATLAVDINNGSEIVGRYNDMAGTHGFILSGGNFTTIDFPGAVLTKVDGINVAGDIVGHYVSQGQQEHGFLLSAGAFTPVDFPNAAQTLAIGINDSGAIAGYYVDPKGKTHGFVRADGQFTRIDYPGASYTEAWRVNNAGQISGRYLGSDGNYHLFRFTPAGFESFNAPGAVQTAPAAYSHVGGLNNLGDIVSTYASDTPFANLNNPNVFGNVHGLLFSDGVFSSIDAPGAVETIAFGIDDFGRIVGVYADSNGRPHGFLRTP